MEKIKAYASTLLMGLVWVSVAAGLLWAAGAVYYFPLLPPVACAILSVVYVTGIGWALTLGYSKNQWLSLTSVSIVVIYLCTLLYQPTTERHWDPDHAKMPSVSWDGKRATIHHFRSTRYRSETDYDARFGTFEFELDQLTDVWFVVQRFTSLKGLAHTFITFGLETDQGPRYFSVSVEIRREKGEVYSPIRGLYRQYELIYVMGEEQDLIGVRTVMRPNDQVYMYRVHATPTQVQELFRGIATRATQLNTRPEFYNTLLNNCTNNIVWHTYPLTDKPINWLDPRIVLPGYSDRFAHRLGLIGDEQMPFEEVASKARIDGKAKATGLGPGFSQAIRSELD